VKTLIILKALADESRLEIFRLLLDRDAYIEVISERLKLSPSTVSFHLKKLYDAGLITSRKDQYYTIYSAVPKVVDLSIKDMISNSASTLNEQNKVEEDYKEKVLKSFFKYGRLIKIPIQKKKREWVMERIANNFLPNKNYSSNAATKLLSEVYEDTGLLLKELQNCGYLVFNDGVIKRK
jgi:ArsR family transcriptional regulator